MAATGNEVVSLSQLKNIVGKVNVWNTTKTDGQFYKAADAPTSTTAGKYDGYFYATRVYNAVYNDYAEFFPHVEQIETGHIAYATKDGVAAVGEPKTCVGIVSDQYGHILGGTGDGHDEENFTAIALAGRVPLQVEGKIEIGDLVAATNYGLGKKATNSTPRNEIVGKMIGFDPQGRDDYVEVLVGGF